LQADRICAPDGLNEAFEHVTGYGLWACECAASNCLERISLTLAEYEAIREHPNRFAVIPSDAHFFPDVEVVVEKTDRYWVVEKIGEARRVAVELDPRGGSSSAVV
jgi:hypothetical protein